MLKIWVFIVEYFLNWSDSLSRTISLSEPHEGDQEQDRRGEDQLLPVRPVLRAARREDGRPGQVVPHVRRGQEGGRGQAAQGRQREARGLGEWGLGLVVVVVVTKLKSKTSSSCFIFFLRIWHVIEQD